MRMRKLILLGCLLALPLRAPIDPFTERVLRFELSWDKFVRGMFGCPQKVVLVDPITECRPVTGKIDLREFRQTCLRASELYGFDKEVCRAE